eukprot:m.41427 g.41427  ORF g.41427 m.41427 type:complete len:135 (-) comp10556_c0_seq2:1884-2288(-)
MVVDHTVLPQIRTATMDESGKKIPVKPAKEFQMKYLAPLAWAPALHLIRIYTRTRPNIRPYLFFPGVAAAFLHGSYLLLFDLDVTSNPHQQQEGTEKIYSPSAAARMAALKGSQANAQATVASAATTTATESTQ